MYIVHIFVWSFTTHRIYIGNKWMPFICDSMPGLTMHRIYSDNKSMPFRCHYCSNMPGLTTWLSRCTLPLNFGVLSVILLNDKSSSDSSDKCSASDNMEWQIHQTNVLLVITWNDKFSRQVECTFPMCNCGSWHHNQSFEASHRKPRSDDNWLRINIEQTKKGKKLEPDIQKA